MLGSRPLFYLTAVIAGMAVSGAYAQEAQQPPVSDSTAVGVVPPVQEAPQAEKPLMVIRFNAARVHYQNSLVLAVSKAKEAKPNAKFKVVSYVPVSNSRLQNERNAERAKNNLAVIVQQIQTLGVNDSQINASAQTDESLTSQEIHIYVS